MLQGFSALHAMTVPLECLTVFLENFNLQCQISLQLWWLWHIAILYDCIFNNNTHIMLLFFSSYVPLLQFKGVKSGLYVNNMIGITCFLSHKYKWKWLDFFHHTYGSQSIQIDFRLALCKIFYM